MSDPQTPQPPGPPEPPEPSPTPPGTPVTLPPWSRMHLWQFQPLRDVLVVALVLGLLWLGQKISIVTVPVLLAIMLAYLFEPVIRWVTARTKLQRKTAVAGIIVGTILLVVVPIVLGLSYGIIQGVGLISSMTTKIQALNDSVEAQVRYDRVRGRIDELQKDIEDAEWDLDVAEAETKPDDPPRPPDAPGPEEIRKYLAELHAEVDQTQDELPAAQAQAEQTLENLRDVAGDSWLKIRNILLDENARAGFSTMLVEVENRLQSNADRLALSAATAGASVVQTAGKILSGTFALLFMAFLTAFFFFFISNEWMKFKLFTARFIPEKHKDTVLDLAVKFDRVVSGFVRGRLTIAFLQSIVFTIGYFLIGVPAAFVLGPMVAVLSIVPYLALVGLPVSIVLLWLENHSGVRGNALWVLGAPTVFYFIAQALDDYVWTPVIQGKETGMSTPMILFASLAGGVLFGVFGLLIAIPIAACLKIIIQELLWPRFKAWAEGDAEDFLPISR